MLSWHSGDIVSLICMPNLPRTGMTRLSSLSSPWNPSVYTMRKQSTLLMRIITVDLICHVRLSVAAANHTTTQTHKQTNQHDNSRMADKERKQCLRLEGKCFNCEGTDHIERSGPRRWQTKDKHSGQRLLLNSVGMSAAEARLAGIEEGTELGLFALGTAVDSDQAQASSATRRKPIPWTAFPNAKQVILKLPDEPTRSLEGGNAEHLHNSPINTANLTLRKDTHGNCSQADCYNSSSD